MTTQLLYRAAEWHALAKLRMHTNGTLKLLEACTTSFGSLMRRFRNKTFADFNTVSLPKESRKSPSSGRKRRPLNLNTYKFHSLGDYVRTIKLFGSTDNYSTLTVSRQCFFFSSRSHVSGGIGASHCQKVLWNDKQETRDKADCKAPSS